jgi:hypothetical protein
MTRLLLVALLIASATPAAAEPAMPWYRGFYTRVGARDSYGVQEPFHAWAAASFGLGYRFNRACWGVDVSVANLQFDPEEGMHTLARVVPYQGLQQWTAIDMWIGAGLSYGWVKGTVDQTIPKRRGEGFQAEAIVGIEMPRTIRVRTFVQFTLTVPLYHLRDNYRSRDSTLEVVALEGAYGVRF